MMASLMMMTYLVLDALLSWCEKSSLTDGPDECALTDEQMALTPIEEK
jgi:hypothetical protein